MKWCLLRTRTGSVFFLFFLVQKATWIVSKSVAFFLSRWVTLATVVFILNTGFSCLERLWIRKVSGPVLAMHQSECKILSHCKYALVTPQWEVTLKLWWYQTLSICSLMSYDGWKSSKPFELSNFTITNFDGILKTLWNSWRIWDGADFLNLKCSTLIAWSMLVK